MAEKNSCALLRTPAEIISSLKVSLDLFSGLVGTVLKSSEQHAWWLTLESMLLGL